jgi:hypothetical protein
LVCCSDTATAAGAAVAAAGATAGAAAAAVRAAAATASSWFSGQKLSAAPGVSPGPQGHTSKSTGSS